MKRSAFLFLFLLLALCQTNILSAQPVIPEIKQSHPRIMLFKEDESALIASIKKDSTWNNIHMAILGECDQIIKEEPIKRIQISQRQLDKFK